MGDNTKKGIMKSVTSNAGTKLLKIFNHDLDIVIINAVISSRNLGFMLIPSF